VLGNGYLVSVSCDGSTLKRHIMQIWDVKNVKNGKIQKVIKTNSSINSVEVLSNSDLVVGTSDKSLIIWN
jgi:WD40 repeat protein